MPKAKTDKQYSAWSKRISTKFESASTIEAVKDLYFELKPDVEKSACIRSATRLRELHDGRLLQLKAKAIQYSTKSSSLGDAIASNVVGSAQQTIDFDKPAPPNVFETIKKSVAKVDAEAESQIVELTNAYLIKHYRQQLQCHIPVSRGCNEWSEERFTEHMFYWCSRRAGTHKQVIQRLVEVPSMEARQAYLDSLLGEDNE